MVAFGDVEMDDVFKALADPSRRMLLDSLNARNGQTLRELCAGLDMARQSVSKHLAVLEAAGLVTTVRRGREKLHYLNAAPISDIAQRWISRYDQPRVDALADLKKALEETEVEAPSFVYTTYIRTTPERLWQGLTDPAFTRRYKLAGERRSKVTFDIEPVTQGVKLTVIHDGFEPDSTVAQMVSIGWPDVISSLKTLLETGEPLPA